MKAKEEQKELPRNFIDNGKYSSVNDLILEANQLLYSQNEVKNKITSKKKK